MELNNLENNLIEICKQRNYSTGNTVCIIAPCRGDEEKLQKISDWLNEHPNATEDEALDFTEQVAPDDFLNDEDFEK